MDVGNGTEPSKHVDDDEDIIDLTSAAKERAADIRSLSSDDANGNTSLYVIGTNHFHLMIVVFTNIFIRACRI